jgi:hypothetical protein
MLNIEKIWKRKFEYSVAFETKGIKELTGNPIQAEKKIPITNQNDDDFTSITVGLLFIMSAK